MKFMTQAKRFGAVVLSGVVATQAHAAGGPFDTIIAAVDLSTVGTFVGSTGVLVVGIAMAFKGIDLAKRAIKKA